CYQHKSGWTF
nr:immunoglobulin light chain junction region [Macaca mulatta]